MRSPLSPNNAPRSLFLRVVLIPFRTARRTARNDLSRRLDSRRGAKQVNGIRLMTRKHSDKTRNIIMSQNAKLVDNAAGPLATLHGPVRPWEWREWLRGVIVARRMSRRPN